MYINPPDPKPRSLGLRLRRGLALKGVDLEVANKRLKTNRRERMWKSAHRRDFSIADPSPRSTLLFRYIERQNGNQTPALLNSSPGSFNCKRPKEKNKLSR